MESVAATAICQKLHRGIIDEKVGNGGGSGNMDADAKAPRLSKTQLRMLAEIRNDPNITKAKLAARLEVGKTTVDNGIAALRKYGYIERVGSNKAGYWNVLDR